MHVALDALWSDRSLESVDANWSATGAQLELVNGSLLCCCGSSGKHIVDVVRCLDLPDCVSNMCCSLSSYMHVMACCVIALNHGPTGGACGMLRQHLGLTTSLLKRMSKVAALNNGAEHALARSLLPCFALKVDLQH